MTNSPCSPDIVERLNAHGVGHPYAKIEWPHRLLHDARDEIERLRAQAATPPAHADRDELLVLADIIGSISGRMSLEDDRVAIIIAATQLRRFAGVAQPPLSTRLGIGLLWTVHSALDEALGDTDVTHIEDDAELREEYPVQWAAGRLAHAIEELSAATGGDAVAATQQEGLARVEPVETGGQLPPPPSTGVAQGAWMPIETAPKDKRIMLCVAGFVPSAGRWWPLDSCWMSFDWEGHFESDTEASEYANGTSYEPTHWMPLPASPSVSSTDGGVK